MKDKFLNSRFHQWLLNWKPIPLCWWFRKHGWKTPRYLIGHDVFTLNQSRYRFRNDDGSETTATWKAAENTAWEVTSIPSDINFRLRVGAQEIGNVSGSSDYLLQYSLNGGTFTTITTTSNVVRIVTSSNFTDGASTTKQLSGTGTFNGGQMRESNTASSVTYTALGNSEHEWMLTLRSADYALGDNVKFRLLRSGSPLSTITQTPEIFGWTPIDSIEDLDNIRNNVVSSRIVGNYKLSRDLDFNDDDSYDNAANKSTYTTGEGWVPLGQTGNPWYGANFDGNGHTISNLMVNDGTTGEANAGLFGVTDSCTIENLGLINPRINANATATTGMSQVGALIMGIDPEAAVIVRKCYVRGGVVRGVSDVGGLIGISHEYSTGSVNILDCYVEGTSVIRNGTGTGALGGFVGRFNTVSSGGPGNDVFDSYAATTLTGTSSTNKGAFLGQDSAAATNITTSYYDSTRANFAGAGGTAQTSTQLKDFSTFSANWDIAVDSSHTTQAWWINDDQDYPRLYYEPKFDQAAFRFYEDGTESGSTAIAAQGTDITLPDDSNYLFHLRLRIQETSAHSGFTEDDYQIQWSLNGGSFVSTLNGFTPINPTSSSSITDNEATTNRLTGGSGTFVAGKARETGASAGLISNVKVTASNYTELVWVLTTQPGTAGLVADDTIDIRTLRNGIPIETYGDIPRITIVAGTPTFEVSGTTDALKRKQDTKTHTTDALIRTQPPVSHTTDAMKKSVETVAHTTDSNKKKATTLTHSTDSNKKKETTVSHTTDANKKVSGNIRSHTTDALKRAQLALTHTTDALKRTVNTLTHSTDSFKARAERYWVGNSGNWSDTNHWSYTTGGAGGAPVPTSLDGAIFDANSFSGTGHTVTFDVDPECKDFDASAVGSDNPTFTGSATLSIYGDFRLASGVTWAHDYRILLLGVVVHDLDTNGVVMPIERLTVDGIGSYTLQSDFVQDANGGDYFIWVRTGHLDLNGNTLDVNGIFVDTSLDFSSGTMIIRDYNAVLSTGVDGTGGTLIFAGENRSTFNLGGNIDFGSGITLATLEIQTTPDDVSLVGSLTATTMEFDANTSIFFDPSATYTASTWNFNGTAGNVVTMDRWGGSGQYDFVDTSGTNTGNHLTINNNIASGGAVWLKGTGFSGTNTSGWLETITQTHGTDALKRKTNTLTHTTDSNKRKVNTLTHTTDALLREQNTLSHTTDSNLRKVTEASHTTDSNKRKVTEASHTTDALKRTQNTLTHSTDSFLAIGVITDTREHTTDALKRKTNTLTHTTDSNKRRVTEVVHSTDANKKKEGNLLTHTTDALLRQIFTLDHTTDALKRTLNVLTHTTDAFKRTQNVLTHTTDSNKRRVTEVSHTTDSNKRKETTVFHSTDSNKKKADNVVSHTTDALKRTITTLSHTTDALLRTLNTLAHSTDAFLLKAFDVFHTTDSNKRKVTEVSHTIDSNKRKADNVVSHTTDALKRTISTLTHSTDSLIRKLFTLSHSTDSFLRTQNTVDHTTDANKKKQTEASHTTDANKKKSDNTVTHTTDANKRVVSTVQHTTDALLRTVNTLVHTTDALKRTLNTLVHTTDSFLRKANIVSHTTDSNKRRVTEISHTTDSNKKKSDNVVTHTTDSLIRKENVLTHSTDANKLKPTELSHTTDALIRTEVEVDHTTDANKRKASELTHTTDSNKRKETIVSHTTDSNKLKVTEVSHTTDSLLASATARSHNTDANKRKETTRVHTTDANKKTSDNVLTHTTDSFLRQRNTVDHTTDSNVRKPTTASHSTDSILRKLFSVFHSTDANKKTEGLILTHTTDAFLREELTVDHTTDANKRRVTELTHTTDSLKRSENVLTHTTDANKKKVTLVVHTTDSLKRALSVLVHTTDSLKRTLNTLIHTTDSNKRKATEVSHTTDSFLRGADQQVHTTDANKRKAQQVSHLTDALKRTQNVVSHSTDSLKRRAVLVLHMTDALLRREVTVVHTTDSMKRTQNQRTHTTDSNKRTTDNQVFHTTDALKITSYFATHTTDSNKRKFISVTHSTDASIKVPYTVFHSTDALINGGPIATIRVVLEGEDRELVLYGQDSGRITLETSDQSVIIEL